MRERPPFLDNSRAGPATMISPVGVGRNCAPMFYLGHFYLGWGRATHALSPPLGTPYRTKANPTEEPNGTQPDQSEPP